VAPVPGPVPAGGCTIHNGLTAHGAGPNMTPFERRAMSFQFMPADTTFNGIKNILPPDYQDVLAVGDVLDNNEHLPLYRP
jgi:ectoine hydroxylase-related dioxygenase (phytanoyl-CoA dioxygenase family)